MQITIILLNILNYSLEMPVSNRARLSTYAEPRLPLGQDIRQCKKPRIRYNRPMNLTDKRCKPCEGKTPPLSPEKIRTYAKQLREWNIEKNLKIEKEFRFKNFKDALSFLNRVGKIAEEEGHHPDAFISYNRVRLGLTTHAIDGLSENDFILAAKIDALEKPNPA